MQLRLFDTNNAQFSKLKHLDMQSDTVVNAIEFMRYVLFEDRMPTPFNALNWST
jgi:hypothetical protein